MADETYASLYIWDIFAGGDPRRAQAVVVGEASIKPGDAIRIHTDGKMYLAKASDGVISGFAALMPGHDIDTAYDYATTPEMVEYYPVGQDTEIWAKFAARSPLVGLLEGQVAILSATDGQLKAFDATAYTDAAAATDTIYLKAGVIRKYDVGHLTEMRITKISLSG